jgi:release factor glutamine methyltransferase
MDKSWTLLDLLNVTRDYLAGKGIENPRGSTEALLGKVLNMPRVELYVQHDRPLREEEVEQFRSLIKRRLKHEPLQLILGKAEFCGAMLELAPGLLIPRPETEELVENVLREISSVSQNQSLRALDIGCGTGCIAVALAKHATHVTVDAVDIEPTAIRITESNAARNGVLARVNSICADLFSPQFTQLLNPPYDVLISNPPYVREQDFSQLTPEVRLYESRLALVASEEGLAFYRRISILLPTLLRPHGLVALEVGFGQSDSVCELLHGGLDTMTVHKDLAGIARMIFGRRKQEAASKTAVS